MEVNQNDIGNTYDFDITLESLLQLNLSDFDLDIFNLPLPNPPPKPFTVDMTPQLPSLPEKSNNLEMTGVGANAGENSGERGMEHCRDRNRGCLGVVPTIAMKKTWIPPEKIADLKVNDPKKAKRIIANRIAAQKSKERKKVYEKELEKRVEALQIEADKVTAERVRAMNEALSLAAENKKIKELIECRRQEYEERRVFIESLKEQARMLEMQIHEQNIAINDPSFGEPSSQSQLLELPNDHGSPATDLYMLPPLSPPLVPPPPPPSPFGQPFDDQFVGIDFSNYNLSDFFGEI